MISQREKEIQNIVRSIYDLNEIFKDLAVMIIDQVRQVKSVKFPSAATFLLNFSAKSAILRQHLSCNE